MSKAAGSLSIRACRLEDIQSVLELWRQADATPGVTDNADDLRRAVAASPAHVLVAEVGGRIVGSVIGTFDGRRGNIYRLAVHPDHRRQGIARALAAEAEKMLVGQGARRITALVEKEQPWAMNFWEMVVLDLKPEGFQLLKFKDIVLTHLGQGPREHTVTAFREYGDRCIRCA